MQQLAGRPHVVGSNGVSRWAKIVGAMRHGLILAALLAVATTAATENESVVHEVDLEHRYQTIDHFGASDCWTTRIPGKWSKEKRERVADLLFSREKGIGLSLWRFNLGAGLQPERITDPL